MNLFNGNSARSLCLFALMLFCLVLFTSQANAQCCCGGIHISMYGKNKKPISPEVTAIIGRGKPGETMLPRLIEPKEQKKGHQTIRVSADCYGFSLMEITVKHKSRQMVLRLRDLPFGELGEIYLEPLAFRPGTFEIDFKGELERHCKRTTGDLQCLIPAGLWRKVSERPESELAPPTGKGAQSGGGKATSRADR